MSKAFTKEDDEIPERIVRVRPASGLPPGALNYMTADGARRLREELKALEQSSAALPGTPIRHERIDELQQALASATIVPLPNAPREEVLFGATVTLRYPDGTVACHRVVGVDEVHLDTEAISWISPLAKALIGARAGDRVRCADGLAGGEIAVMDVRD